MSTTVRIPTPLRTLTGGQRRGHGRRRHRRRRSSRISKRSTPASATACSTKRACAASSTSTSAKRTSASSTASRPSSRPAMPISIVPAIAGGARVIDRAALRAADAPARDRRGGASAARGAAARAWRGRARPRGRRAYARARRLRRASSPGAIDEPRSRRRSSRAPRRARCSPGSRAALAAIARARSGRRRETRARPQPRCSPRSPTRWATRRCSGSSASARARRRVEIYAKLEFANPGGSVKDRAALRMMRDAHRGRSARARQDAHRLDQRQHRRRLLAVRRRARLPRRSW